MLLKSHLAQTSLYKFKGIQEENDPLLHRTFQVKSHKNINLIFRSHSGFSSVVAAHGLDSVRPFSSQAEQDFSPRGWGYSSGKIPAGHNKIYLLDVFEWIQSPQRGCHRSLAVAAWWRKNVCQDVLLFGDPSLAIDAGLWKCGNLGQMFSSMTLLHFTLLFPLP